MTVLRRDQAWTKVYVNVGKFAVQQLARRMCMDKQTNLDVVQVRCV
jgi:hypothetical protein